MGFAQPPYDNPDMPSASDFPLPPCSGLAFWRWGAASEPTAHAPDMQFWWHRLRDQDKDRLGRARAEHLAGNAAPIEMVVRARRPDSGWDWLLVRGSAVVNAGGQRELAGYVVDISRLGADGCFAAPAGQVRRSSRHPPGLIPSPEAGGASAPGAFFSSRHLPPPTEDAGKAEAWDSGIHEELLRFHRRNIAAVFESGAEVTETVCLHTSLCGETVHEYCYRPEFGPDDKVCAVICQMRDLDGRTAGRESRAGEEQAAFPDRPPRTPGDSGEYMHALEKAKAMAETANRTKDEFLANVSHELRTPLNGVIGMLQLLQLSSLSEEQREYVRIAGLSGQALLRIIADILDFSRMESGRMELRDGIFDLRETLLSTMSLFISQARSKGLEVTVSIDESLPAALVGDDARVRQIVFNLVGNALKFTKQGGIGLECSLLPHTTRDKAWVYIAVRDTGMGMPPQMHGAIFDPFTQLDSSSTREHSGTGLGLVIVKRLVRMMDGTLAVESEEGEGTTIHCSLPFARADRRVADRMRRRPSFAGQRQQRLDVLVAEDDPVGRFALSAFLLRAGHRAVCVESGLQALEAAQLHAFDCLITDIQLPVMDGLEITRRIRQGHFSGITPSREVADAVRNAVPEASATARLAVPRDLPVIALTAHAMSGDREYFLSMGMDMYLAKPIIMEELYAVLDRVLAGKDGREAAGKASAGRGPGNRREKAVFQQEKGRAGRKKERDIV